MKPLTIKEALVKVLTKKEVDAVGRSYDRIGNLIILEIPEELEKKEKKIGQVVLENLPNVETVAKKFGHHYGKYRLQKLRILAGKRNKTSIHKESGVLLKINPEKTYFSPRLSNERLRIAKQVKEGEDILVMFSGAAPYPSVLAKNANPKSIVGVELNPHAHELALENIRLNKIKNTALYCGDAGKIVPKLKRKFDRIIMPLPKSSEDFLEAALTAAKKGTLLNVYCFCNESDYDELANHLKKRCADLGKKVKVMEVVPCGQHAPRMFRVCVDMKVI